MHWLPLVAMVIASALPFPHEPAARIVAASLPPPPHHAPEDYNSHQPEDYNSHQPEDYNSNQPEDYNSRQPEDYNSHQPEDYNSHQPEDYNSRQPEDYNSHQPEDYNSHQPEDYNSHQTEDYNSHQTEDHNSRQPEDYNSHQPEDYNSVKRTQRDLPEQDDSGVYILNTLEVPPTEPTPVRTRDVTEDVKIFKNSVDFNRKTDNSDVQRTEKGPEESLDTAHLGLAGLLEGDMFLDAHPRVLFSTSPPQRPPPMLEEGVPLDWDEPAFDGARREKRSHLTEARWGQRSVCESVNVWVTDKMWAVDTKGNKVSIIQEIQTQSGPIKQYFYETRCRQAELPQDGRHEETGVDGGSCLGIDKKQWKSRCIAKPSFVRALTKDSNNRMGWRWIRIDASCVCVLLSRTNSKAPSGRGRG